MKPKLLIVLGQTATGKSDLAVELAMQFKGEVISADSRQVYIGLDIGTGKIIQEEMKGVPHHLLDVIPPEQTFTAAEWKKSAEEKIAKIVARGNLPIICGGTGFYIEQIVKDIDLPDVPPDPALRAELFPKPAPELFEMLQKLDPDRAEHIDPQNPVRLVRAIEIAIALGTVPPVQPNDSYDVLQIGLTLPDEELRARIHRRLVARMDTGMIQEAERLHAEGLSWERMRQLGLEYRFLADLLEEKLTRAEFTEKLEIAIWHYARRQKQWFRRDPSIRWFNPADKETITQTVRDFLHN